jgi:hypothetical protein
LRRITHYLMPDDLRMAFSMPYDAFASIELRYICGHVRMHEASPVDNARDKVRNSNKT